MRSNPIQHPGNSMTIYHVRGLVYHKGEYQTGNAAVSKRETSACSIYILQVVTEYEGCRQMVLV